MKNEIKKTSKIDITIGLNDQKVPVDITWHSDDQPNENGKNRAKAMLLSLFDKTHMDTLKIDLWTTEMQVLEMDRFFYQTLRGLADTYYKATQNAELANEMQRFVQYFGEKTEIIPPVK
ncbi:MAG: gliding motility protein GldC [Saprospiraceae bacterium]|nr:gliding motility protein GldC [Saprospiraceae bacterium]